MSTDTIKLSGVCSFRFKAVLQHKSREQEFFKKQYAELERKVANGYKPEGKEKAILSTNGDFEAAIRMAFTNGLRDLLSEHSDADNRIGKGSIKVTYDERHTVSD